MPPATDSNHFSIRRANNADIPAVRLLIAAVRTEFSVEPPAGPTDPDLDDIEATYLACGGLFEVVEDRQGRIVGCAGFCRLHDSRGELRKMYILPSARGFGLGRKLLENMLQSARRQGYAEIWLETNSVLTTAVALYERYGFRPVPADHLSPRCDQAYLLKL